MSNRNDDQSTPRARPVRPFVAHPTRAGSPTASSPLAGRVARPFVPPAAARDRALRAGRGTPGTGVQPTDGSAIAASPDDAWLATFAADAVDIDPSTLAGAASAPPVVPGADVGPPPTIPVTDADAARSTDADEAAAAEWAAIGTLGAADAPAHRRDPAADGERRVSERALAVVPPSEAWPDDVWTDPAASTDADAAEPTGYAPPVTMTDDRAPADAATPRARAGGAGPTSYPPAVPDAPDDYALDGTQRSVGIPSPVYLPDGPAGWDASTADARGSMNDPAKPAATADEARLAARLRLLADEIEARSIAAPGYTAGMRDSEALVTVLGALLRAER